MNQDLKKIIHGILHSLLWLAFVCMVFDPAPLGVRPLDSGFAYLGFLADINYQISNFMISPFTLLWQMMHPVPLSWFPQLFARDFTQPLNVPGLQPFIPFLSYPGVIQFWFPIASIVYTMIIELLFYVVGTSRNWALNFVVEHFYQEKVKNKYEAEIEKRNDALKNLDHKFKNLSKEAHTLKDTVMIDELTQLYNKRFFLNQLQSHFKRCKDGRQLFSLIMIDIDFFKRLNDTYGHLIGDVVLKAVSGVLKQNTPAGSYACRYGGEEFSVVMPDASYIEVKKTAINIQKAVEALAFPDVDSNLKVTLSQGLCSVDFAFGESSEIQKFDDVLSLADKELYKSKMGGRNRISTYTILPDIQ
jgi:diguanylate cyclase (GGDEF)-like protein